MLFYSADTHETSERCVTNQIRVKAQTTEDFTQLTKCIIILTIQTSVSLDQKHLSRYQHTNYILLYKIIRFRYFVSKTRYIVLAYFNNFP